jgi:hypothetical protein
VSYSLVHDGTKQNCFNQHLHASISSRQEIFCYHQSEDQKFSQNSEKTKSWLVQHFLHRKQTALQISVFNAWIILFGALTSPAHPKKTVQLGQH